MRTFAIGDIHGAYKALKQVINKLDLQKNDKLIFLGDYVDGWSQPVEVIDYLLELNNMYNCVFVRGNHDVKCSMWLKHKQVIGDWLMHGGGASQEAYAKVSEQKIQTHLDFIASLVDYHIDEDNCLFIHAGFTSMKGVHKEEYKSNYCWDRTLWESAYALDPNLSVDSLRYPLRLKLYKEIFIGHTATTRYGETKPIQAGNVWNVDTGAAFTGKLTALDISSKEIFQSDTVMNLYVNEKGRN